MSSFQEAFVHPLLSSHSNPARVCIYGTSNCLQEVLKWPSVKEVDVFENQTGNNDSASDNRVIRIQEDLEELLLDTPKRPYDAIFVNLQEGVTLASWEIILSNMTEKWLSPEGSLAFRVHVSGGLLNPMRQLKTILTTHTNFRMYQNDNGVYELHPIRDIITYDAMGDRVILLKDKNSTVNLNKCRDQVNYKLTDEMWEATKIPM